MIDLKNIQFKTLSDPIYIGNHKIDEIWKGNKKIYPTSFIGGWFPKPFNNFDDFVNGYYFWTDGINTYYSRTNDQYIFDPSAFTLHEQHPWNFEEVDEDTGEIYIEEGYPRFGWQIWRDGNEIHYGSNYILNKATSTFELFEYNQGDEDYWGWFYNGSGIWTDGTNLYSSQYDSYNRINHQWVLDRSSSTWYKKTWNGYDKVSGSMIWSDGNNYYYSESTKQYVLDKSTSSWAPKTWHGLTSFAGQAIWRDYNGNIFVDDYILDKTTSTWSKFEFKPALKRFNGRYVWSDGRNIYYCDYKNSGNEYNNYILM